MLRACLGATVFCALLGCRDHGASPALAHLRAHARDDSRAYDVLRSLTDEVGPRLSGSPGDAAGVAWALRTLATRGFANVHTEPATVTHWERGDESGEMLTPASRSVALAAIGGSVATPSGGIEADVVEVESLDALDRLPRERVAGRIVYVHVLTMRSREGAGYGKSVGVRVSAANHASRLGAVGVIIRSIGTDTQRTPHTGTLVYAPDVVRIPAAALSIPDADLLHRRIATGAPVRFRMRLGARTFPDALSANVIGDVTGRELPDQVVLLGAHLDSWDLGQGALDDGAGCAIVIEAARLLSRVSPRPRRTVRVVLYANEENGSGGARAYASAHRDELARHVVAIEADSGDGAVWSMRVPAVARESAAARRLVEAMQPLGIALGVGGSHGGADVAMLAPAGVPLVDLRQDGSRYFDVHHSANDTLAQVHRDDLDRAVAAMATAAYALAEMPETLGRVVGSSGH